MKRLLSIMLAAVLALSIVGSWRAEELNRTAKDFAGEVTVVITIDNDKIVAVTAKGESEMFVIDNYALEELPDSIVEDESVDVDAFAGSTVAGNAVKTAASNALAPVAYRYVEGEGKAFEVITAEVADAFISLDVVSMGHLGPDADDQGV